MHAIIYLICQHFNLQPFLSHNNNSWLLLHCKLQQQQLQLHKLLSLNEIVIVEFTHFCHSSTGWWVDTAKNMKLRMEMKLSSVNTPSACFVLSPRNNTSHYGNETKQGRALVVKTWQWSTVHFKIHSTQLWALSLFLPYYSQSGARNHTTEVYVRYRSTTTKKLPVVHNEKQIKCSVKYKLQSFVNTIVPYVLNWKDNDLILFPLWPPRYTDPQGNYSDRYPQLTLRCWNLLDLWIIRENRKAKLHWLSCEIK